MARDESQHHGDDQSGIDESENRGRDSADPITITTSDPAIESSVEHTSDWKIHPDSTLSIQTTQAHEPNPLYVVGVRKVVHEDRESRPGGQRQDGDKAGDRSNKGNQSQADKSGEKGHSGGATDDQKKQGGDQNRKDEGDAEGKDGSSKKGQASGDQKRKSENTQDGGSGQKKDRGQAHDQKKDGDDQRRGQQNQKQPSLMKSLLMTAGIATVCGLVGAFGYSYFAGGGKNSGEQEKGQSDSKSGSSKSSKSSSGGESQQGSNESGEGQSGAGTKVALIPAKEIGTLNQQLVDLMVRVDRLGERVDRIVRPNDETPPIIKSLQMEIGEIFHELDKLATVGEKVLQHGSRLEILQREIQVLRSRLDSSTPSISKGLVEKSEAINPSEPLPVVNQQSSAQTDTLEQGLRLLEQGQYDSARREFQRLEATLAGDARVWYFAALAVGLASGDWNDEAKDLAERGIECERAGTPSSGVVDSTLATRGPAEGKAWLNALRRRSLSASRTQ